MKFIKKNNHKLKILGLTIFKVKHTQYGVKLYLFGIPFFRVSFPSVQIANEFRKNKDFDVRDYDERIASLLKNTETIQSNLKSSRLAYLATICYDIGGHTKCIRDLAKSLNGYYEQRLFLTQKSESERVASNILKIISQFMSIDGIDASLFSKFEKEVQNFANRIIDFAPQTLLVYIHPDDIFGTAVIALLKKTTNIKIVFFNHASHYPCLGMSFADIILEGMPTTENITQKQRGFKNTRIIGLQSLEKDETIYYSKNELSNLKKQLGISEDSLLTMSGGSAYKFFTKDNSSDYFEMIKNLLLKEPKLKHVIISEFNDKQKTIINKIFSNHEELKNRIVFVPYQNNFDKYFQCADVFIDSFPVSSALTQIDLMRNKVASAVKINKEIPEYSFHEYQMPDYPYMFSEVDDMEKAILDLLHTPNKREQIIAKNYDYWLKTYESSVVRDKYIDLFKGASK